ncbi:MAG: hypothetical protein HQK59_05705 [Deltaproteobacteria bacterium]|nr:hypothetical protein [Deltaproteobacteria bacterium]
MIAFEFDIEYSRDADKFLEKNQSVVSKDRVKTLVTSAMRKIIRREDINVDLIQLKGEPKGTFRIKTGDARIIFKLYTDPALVAFVKEVVFRKDAYR